MALILDRRNLLAAAAALGSAGLVPGLAFAAAPTARRLVFIIQRGAADGLAVLPPVGDPELERLRGNLLDPEAARIDALFALHPALAETGKLFAAGEVRAHHAVATTYRERSHFDGQNVLESGALAPHASDSGWLGRLLPLLPGGAYKALALAPAVPLALRGSAPVATYAPSRLPDASEDLLLRLSALYEEDPLLAPLWSEALKTRNLAGDIGGNAGRNGAELGALAAKLLIPADGARVMMIETGGWDTHSNQKGRLAAQLRGLDQLIAELRRGLGPVWADTLVIVATEFGRTAAANGTSGTDHGTASAAFLLGGGLPKGPPVVSDWPGLKQSALYEGRDLRPTASLGTVIAGALSGHFEIEQKRLSGLFAG
jgi:uncharacterized protein (DUF1501 family)